MDGCFDIFVILIYIVNFFLQKHLKPVFTEVSPFSSKAYTKFPIHYSVLDYAKIRQSQLSSDLVPAPTREKIFYIRLGNT